MKKYMVVAIVLCGMLTFAGLSSAYTVGSTNVGGLDTFVDQSLQLNSPAEELAWINLTLFGSNTSLYFDTITSLSNVWQDTNTTDVIAMSIPDQPEYFIVKTGNNGGAIDYRDFLFQNVSELDWAVIALQGVESQNYFIRNIGALSHSAEVGGSTPPQVPEPSMLMLFGSGLLGLAFFGRKILGK